MSVTRELVEMAQDGDHDAFEHLAAGLGPRLFATASLIVRDHEAARDAAQETLIEVWRRLPTLRQPDAFEAWAHRILVRRCYAAIGRRRRFVEVPPVERDAPVPSHETEFAIVDQIERAFRRLTPQQRAILVLHHRLGYGDTDAAEILGIPVGTVKSRLNRAKAALRASLEADERPGTAPRRQPA
jgi:RNA polymerase sigma factor (sigma-70 family)